jgi:tetratricopeptide (TPR) repeat protein
MRDEAPQMRIASLDPLLRRHPYLADGFRSRGVAWRELAASGGPAGAFRLGQAERDLTRSVRLRPFWAEAWADLAWVRLLSGRREEARSAIERAAALDPTHPHVATARAEMLTRLELK